MTDYIASKQKTLASLCLVLLLLAGCNDYEAKTPLLDDPVQVLDKAAIGFWFSTEKIRNKEKTSFGPDFCSKDGKYTFEVSSSTFDTLFKSTEYCSGILTLEEQRFLSSTQVSPKVGHYLQKYHQTAVQNLFGREVYTKMEKALVPLAKEAKNIDTKSLEEKMKFVMTSREGLLKELLDLAKEMHDLVVTDKVVLEHVNNLGTVPNVVNSNPNGLLIQYRGNGKYQATNIDGKNFIFSIHKDESSGLLKQNYLFQYQEDGDSVYYQFFSNFRLGGWSTWVPDTLKPRELWKARDFETREELKKFANQVFSGIGFVEEDIVLEELSREDIGTLALIRKCRSNLLESNPQSIDELNRCL